MGYVESIAHEAEGYEGEKNNCFSKIQLVGQKNIEAKHLSPVKARYESFFYRPNITNMAGAFRY